MLTRRKYGNKTKKIDGITFDSQKEAHIYASLKRADGVKSVQPHPKYILQPPFTYIVII